MRFPAVQTFWKSVKIWQRYREFKGGNFCLRHSVCIVFWHQQWLVGDAPFRLKFALEVAHPFKKADFDRFLLITSQPQETAKTVRLWLIDWQRALQRAIDEVRTLPLSPQRVAQKPIFLFFRDKIQFQSNKVFYKVLLCANFQRQCCRAVNQLWNNRKI